MYIYIDTNKLFFKYAETLIVTFGQKDWVEIFFTNYVFLLFIFLTK